MSEELATDLDMLNEAISRSARLVEKLNQADSELQASTAKMDPAQSEIGRRALGKAIESAQALLQSLQTAAAGHSLASRKVPVSSPLIRND